MDSVHLPSDELRNRLSKIKLLALDVDGILTDGGMYYTEQGDEMKRFSTLDGMGISLLRQTGVEVAIITRENTNIVAHRAKKLKIGEVHQGILDKVPTLRAIAVRMGVDMEEVAYAGDDVNDIPPMRIAGLAFSVPHATAEVKKYADYVTIRSAGDGAVREICDLIRIAQGHPEAGEFGEQNQ